MAIATSLTPTGSVPNTGNKSIVSEITPVADKDIIIESFFAEVPELAGAVACLVWKYNHDTETAVNIWAITSSGKIPFKHFIPKSEVDGVRKLAIVLMNQTQTNNLQMSGHSVIKQK